VSANPPSANPTKSPTPTAVPKDLRTGLAGLWGRISEGVLPEVHYLDGEILKLTIRMAPYRRDVPRLFVRIGAVFLLVALVLIGMSFLFIWLVSARLWFSALALGSLSLLGYGLQSLLLYEQWQFILTDKRIILITPDPERRGFADAIYLKQARFRCWTPTGLPALFGGCFKRSKVPAT